MPRAAPVATCHSWDALLATVRAAPWGSALAAYPDRVAMGVLAAPVAVAYWLAQRMPELLDRSRIDALVIGAEKLDAVDGGRWYQLVPRLLGRDSEIRMTLVGDRLAREFRSPAAFHAPRAPADGYCGTLASFLSQAELGRYDIAILFHPGFQKHRPWLEDGSLARLVAAGVPLVVSSYEEDESEIEQWVVAAHGFAAPGAVTLNPFYLDFSERGAVARWGRALWPIGGEAPGAGQAIDVERLAALDELARMVMHSLALGATLRMDYGQSVVARASNGATRELIYVFDDFYLDPHNGQLLSLAGGALTVAGSVSAADLAKHPGSSASDLERAIWAARMKSAYLLHCYPQVVDEATRHTLARTMHAELEHKVEALFRAP